MPLTISHPAAAVPLARFGLPLSALVVGSMAPDFPYFLNVSTHSHYGHTLQGLFLFDLPAGLLVLWLFHAFLKLPLLALARAEHRAKLSGPAGKFRFGPLRRFALILAGLLLGAVSHLAWDSFTHRQGWAVQHLAILQNPVVYSAHGVVCVYSLLQHGSTLAGAALLIYWYARWFQQAPSGARRCRSGCRTGQDAADLRDDADRRGGWHCLLLPDDPLPFPNGGIQALAFSFVIASVIAAVIEITIYSAIGTFVPAAPAASSRVIEGMLATRRSGPAELASVAE